MRSTGHSQHSSPAHDEQPEFLTSSLLTSFHTSCGRCPQIKVLSVFQCQKTAPNWSLLRLFWLQQDQQLGVLPKKFFKIQQLSPGQMLWHHLRLLGKEERHFGGVVYLEQDFVSSFPHHSLQGLPEPLPLISSRTT